MEKTMKGYRIRGGRKYSCKGRIKTLTKVLERLA